MQGSKFVRTPSTAMIPPIFTSRTFTNPLGMEVTIINYMSRIRISWCSKKERSKSKIPFFKSMNQPWWTLKMKSYPNTIVLTLSKETKIIFYRRLWWVECHNTMRQHSSMKILPLGLLMICSSLTKKCLHLWFRDALETAAWGSSAALTLESWYRTS